MPKGWLSLEEPPLAKNEFAAALSAGSDSIAVPSSGSVPAAPGKYSVILILTSQRSRCRAVRLRFFLLGSSDLGVPGGRPFRRQSQ